MKAMAVIGYILAAVALIGGIILSNNPTLPMQGFSAVIGGMVVSFMIALPSTALIGIVQIRKMINNRHT